MTFYVEEPDVPTTNVALAFALLGDCENDLTPVYRGRLDDRAVAEWNYDILNIWAGRKARCLEAVGRLLAATLPAEQAEDTAAPNATVAYIHAVADVGRQWDAVGRELFSLRFKTLARVPNSTTYAEMYGCRGPECLADILAEYAEPWRWRAKPYFKRCIDLSKQLQQWDAVSDECERWLARYWKSEFSVHDEIRPPANRSPKHMSNIAPPAPLERLKSEDGEQ